MRSEVSAGVLRSEGEEWTWSILHILYPFNDLFELTLFLLHLIASISHNPKSLTLHPYPYAVLIFRFCPT
jgi:hypothetical protein